VSFEANAGEVLGIAGVQGNGQTELIKSLLGLIRPDAGTITLDGEDISKYSPRDSLDAGIGYIPEDRSHDGFIGSFSVRENLVLDIYRSDEFARGPALRLDAISDNAKSRIKEFDIRTESMEAPVSSLSGGNQQKVVVAREFSRPLKVLIASQPTRGVDVGSIEFIHKRIIEERDRGTAVVIVSTELDEIFALSDRIAVMYDGRIVGTVSPDIKREDIGLMMAGAHEPEEASA
jgi:simple sugar transport system ATP-binding protein